MIEALHRRLADASVPRMSLSVATANPAFRLYERIGYRVVERTDDDAVMVIDL